MATSLSVNTLPVELLASAFRRVLHSEDTDRKTARYNIAAVSKVWADVIRYTPSLWAQIDHLNSQSMNTLALTRSKDHPLEVAFHLPHESFDEACKHYQRWRSAKFTVRDGDDDLQRLLRPAPALEEIMITANGWKYKNPWACINLFQGVAPRLRRLNLERMAVPWNTPLLTNLWCLNLKNISHCPPLVEDVVNALRSSPQLSVLELRGIAFESALPTTTTTPIHLPRLSQLTLVAIPPDIVNYLLQLIVAPPYEKLALQTTLDDTVPIHKYIPSTLPSKGKAYILLENGNVTYGLDRSPDRTLDLDLVGRSTLDVLQQLLSSASPLFLGLETRLTLITHNDELLQDFDALLTAIGSLRITELYADDLGQDINRLLKRLSTSDWLFPELTSLSISLQKAKSGALGKMVKARHSTASGVALPEAFVTLGVCEAGASHEVDRWAVIRILGAEKVKSWNKI